MSLHLGQYSWCGRCITNSQESSFTSQVEWIESEQIARGAHRWMNGNRCFIDLHSDLRGGCNLIERSSDSSSGGIAQDMQVGIRFKHRCHEGMKWSGVCNNVCLKRNSFTLRQDRSAMIPNGSAYQDHIRGTGSLGGNLHCRRNDSHAGRADKYTIGFASLDDLGITTDDGHCGTLGSIANGGGNAVKLGQRKALFQHKADGQTQWLSPGHRDIIDAAMDREIANAAARKEQR